MPITDGLVEFWPMTEGSGAVAVGAVLGIELDLTRSDRQDNTLLSAGGGWINDPAGGGRKMYNGVGAALLTAGLIALGTTGDAVTMAVRAYLGGGVAAQGGTYGTTPPETGPGDTNHGLCGLPGEYEVTAGPTILAAGTQFQAKGVDDSGGATGVEFEVWQQQPLPSTSRSYTAFTDLDASDAAATVFLFVVTLVREAGADPNIRATAFVNGVKQGTVPGPALNVNLMDLERCSFGDAVCSDGAFGQCAIWDRALTDEEIGDLDEDLDDVADDLDLGGETNPLLDDDGVSRINPDWSVVRTDARRSPPLVSPDSAGLDGLGTGRHARDGGAGVPAKRVYSVPLKLMPGSELAYVRAAIESGRNGAVPQRWRHPFDDAAGDVASAPRWRVSLEGGAIERKGGVGSEAVLVMEEV